MNRETIINALLDLDDCPFNREELEEMEPDRLAFVANQSDLDPSDLTGGEGGADGDGDGDGQTAQNAGAGTEDAPEWAENLISRVEDLADRVENVEEGTAHVREDVEERRERLEQHLAENTSFEREELEQFTLAALEKLKGEAKVVDFTGIGGPSRGSDRTEKVQVGNQSILSGPRGEAAVDGDGSDG